MSHGCYHNYIITLKVNPEKEGSYLPAFALHLDLVLSPADLFGGERHRLEVELAFWSKFAGAYASQVYYLCAFVTTVRCSSFVFGESTY